MFKNHQTKQKNNPHQSHHCSFLYNAIFFINFKKISLSSFAHTFIESAPLLVLPEQEVSTRSVREVFMLSIYLIETGSLILIKWNRNFNTVVKLIFLECRHIFDFVEALKCGAILTT